MRFRSVCAIILLAASVAVLPASAQAETVQNVKTTREPARESEDFAPDKLAHLNREAIDAYKAGNFKEAGLLMDQVISGLEKEKDSELSLAEALANKSLILSKENKTKDAADLLAKTKAIREKLHVATNKHVLVDLLPNEAARRQATEMLRDTSNLIDGKDPLYPPDKLSIKTPAAWSAAMKEALKERDSGDVKTELLTLRRALAIAHILPQSNDKVIITMNMLADTYRHMGKAYSARMLFQHCIYLSEKMGKAETAQYATLLDHSAQTLISLSENEEAEKSLERAMQTYKKALGNESVDLAMTMCTLGELYIKQKQEARGEKMLTDAISMMKKILKDDDSRILISEDCLAGYYFKHGRLKEAEELQSTIIAKMEKSGSKADPNLALALGDLAQTKYRLQKHDEAEALFKRCVEVNKELYGEKHPKTRHAVSTYSNFLEKTKKPQ